MEEILTLEGGGVLTVRQAGQRVHLRAERPDDQRGLYKVWLRGPGGRTLLGTLAPGEGGLGLERLLSRTSLEAAGCWPVTGGEVVMAYSFQSLTGEGGWRRTEHPEEGVPDRVLAACLRSRGGMYLRRRGSGFQLAAEFVPGGEFPLPPLFCLGRVRRAGTGYWVIWEFDGAGAPRAAENFPDGDV